VDLPASSSVVDSIRERILIATVVTTGALAWLVLWRWNSLPYGHLAHAHVHLMAQATWGLFVVFVAGWTLMLVGMMLPTSIPLLNIFSKLTLARRDHWLLVSLVIAGYLAVWTLVGVAAFFAMGGILRLLMAEGWGHAHVAVLGASTLILAGIYQFTPLKYRCLEKCRSPFSFVVQHWTGRNERKNALWLGVHHGIFCVGCCWTLMLLMFSVGAGSVGWMLLLGAFMAIEKNVSWGRRFAKPLGVGLLALGTFMAVRLAR
jgi:predicted metal-binding membrane protein